MLRKDGGNPFEQKWVLDKVKKLLTAINKEDSLNAVNELANEKVNKHFLHNLFHYTDSRQSNILQLFLKHISNNPFSKEEEDLVEPIILFFLIVPDEQLLGANADGDTTLRTLLLSDNIPRKFSSYVELVKKVKTHQFSDVLRCEKSRKSFANDILRPAGEYNREFVFNILSASFIMLCAGIFHFNNSLFLYKNYLFLQNELRVLLIAAFGKSVVTEEFLQSTLRDFLVEGYDRDQELLASNSKHYEIVKSNIAFFMDLIAINDDQKIANELEARAAAKIKNKCEAKEQDSDSISEKFAELNLKNINPFTQKWVLNKLIAITSGHLVSDDFQIFIEQGLKQMNEDSTFFDNLIVYKDSKGNNILQLLLKHINTHSFNEQENDRKFYIACILAGLLTSKSLDAKNADGNTTLRTLFLVEDISLISKLYLHLIDRTTSLEFSDVLRCEKSKQNFSKIFVEIGENPEFFHELLAIIHLQQITLYHDNEKHPISTHYQFLQRELGAIYSAVYYGIEPLSNRFLLKKLGEFLSRFYRENGGAITEELIKLHNEEIKHENRRGGVEEGAAINRVENSQPSRLLFSQIRMYDQANLRYVETTTIDLMSMISKLKIGEKDTAEYTHAAAAFKAVSNSEVSRKNDRPCL